LKNSLPCEIFVALISLGRSVFNEGYKSFFPSAFPSSKSNISLFPMPAAIEGGILLQYSRLEAATTGYKPYS